jgi:transposase
MSPGAGNQHGGVSHETIFARCAGLDIHKESVAAQVRCLEADGRLRKEMRHWGTMTQDLLGMADWLARQGNNILDKIEG